MSDPSTLYKDEANIASYDPSDDTVWFMDCWTGEEIQVDYFTLEAIMENARKAHVMRNNLRMEGEDE